MKRYFYILLIISIIIFSSCSKTPDKSKPATAVNEVELKGKVTENFRTAQWSNYENKKEKADFTSEALASFPSKDYTLLDVYEKDSNIIAVMQNISGNIEYYKIIGDKFEFVKAYNEEAIDLTVMQDIKENEELWGFQKKDDCEIIVKNTGTDVFKGGKLISSLEGVASIGDLDSNETLELIQRDVEGKNLTVYQIINDNLIKVWELASQNEAFDGDIQIGDLNGDGVSEFYVGDTEGNMKKFILTKDGFKEDKLLPVTEKGKSGIYFSVDYNKDGKMDIVSLIQGKVPTLYIQK